QTILMRGRLYQNCDLTQTRLLEHAVGLKHGAEALFRAPVAAIRVRVMAPHQFLIPRLDLGPSGRSAKTTRFQRVGLKGLDLSLACTGGLAFGGEDVEGIADAVVVAGAAGALLRDIGR